MHEKPQRVRGGETGLIEALGMGVFELDVRGALTYANERARRALGMRDEEEPWGRLFSSMVSASHEQAMRDSMRAVSRGYRVKLPFKAVGVDALALSPMYDEDGVFIGAAGHLVESAPARRELTRVRGELRTFRALFETSVEGIALMGPDRRIERANRAFCELVGRTEDELSDQSLFSLVREYLGWTDDLARARAELDELGYTEPIECDYVRGDGTSVPLEVRAWRVYDESSREEWVMAIARDISARRRAQRRRRNTARLDRASRQAALDLRAAGVVRSIVDEVSRGESDGLAALDYACEKTLHAPEQVRFSELVAKLKLELREALGTGRALDVQGEARAEASIDPDALRFALFELMDNALRACGSGRPRLTLRFGELHVDDTLRHALSHPLSIAPGPHVFVEFADRGKGMDALTLERCADLFFSTAPARRGLGLSAVMAIARAHGGGMDVSSSRDRGTTVALLLPAV